MEWRPIETFKRDPNIDILVWYDHDANPYQDPENPERLTDYASWAEGGPFMDGKGICVARWHECTWENLDEYGGGYNMPQSFFAKHMDDYEVVVNPTHWMPLPEPPKE